MNWRALAEQQPWHVAATWIAGAVEVALDIWKVYRVGCNLHPQIGMIHAILECWKKTPLPNKSHPNLPTNQTPSSIASQFHIFPIAQPPPPLPTLKNPSYLTVIFTTICQILLRWVWCFGFHVTEILGGCLGASEPPGRCTTLGAASLKSSLGCCHLAICFSLGTQGGVQSSSGDLWEIWHFEIQFWWNTF